MELGVKLVREVGFKLYKFRLDNGISQKEIANILSVSSSQVHRYEQGESKITFDKIAKIWMHYQVSPFGCDRCNSAYSL